MDGIVVIDEDLTGEVIEDIKVVASKEHAADYVCKNWVDEVFIITSEMVLYPKELIEQLAETGVVVHNESGEGSKSGW